MLAILKALPLGPWMTVDTTPLSPHPSDPAIMYPPNMAATGNATARP
jgi:muconolactone delta-isomerase